MRVPNSNREIITCSIIEADADDDADVLHIGKLRRSLFLVLHEWVSERLKRLALKWVRAGLLMNL